MEKTNITKTSSFPIASFLFLMSLVTTVIHSIFNSSDAEKIVSDSVEKIASSNTVGSSGGGFSILILVCLPLLLFAFSSANTSKKPSVFFLSVSLVQTIVSSVMVLSSLINTVNHIVKGVMIYIIPEIMSILALFIIAIGYLCIFATSLTAKICKKPCVIFKVWFLFPAILTIGFVSNTIVKINFLIISTSAFADPISLKSLVYLFFYSLSSIFLIGAFFAVSYQFAKINKNLPIGEAIEITQ